MNSVAARRGLCLILILEKRGLMGRRGQQDFVELRERILAGGGEEHVSGEENFFLK
jgi:hypothetical protein